jgi:hypothetical protein
MLVMACKIYSCGDCHNQVSASVPPVVSATIFIYSHMFAVFHGGPILSILAEFAIFH